MGMHHTMGQMGGVLFLAAQVTGDGTTTSVSPPAGLSGDFSVTRSSAGVYSCSIKNFKGPQGFAVPCISAGSANTGIASVVSVTTAPSYSGDTLSFGFSCFLGSTASSAFTDSDLYIQVMAF